MIAVTDYFLNQIVAQKSKMPIQKVVISALDGTLDVDISNHIARFGTISRALSFDLGRFSPGGHSLDLLDSKDIGEFLFHFAKQYGSEFWMGKVYNISIGFLNGTSEDLINVGTFEIYSKNENRVSGRITAAGKDVLKRLHDFKITTRIRAQDAFDYDTNNDGADEFTDRRSFQQVVQYGTHKIFTNNGNNKQLNERNAPFTVIEGFPNLGNAQEVGTGGGTRAPKESWYFPIINDVDWVKAHYVSGAFKMYHWDYVRDIWKAFAADDFNTNKFLLVKSTDIARAPGVYLIAFIDGVTLGDGSGAANSWSSYTSGVGAYWGGVGADKVAPAVVAEFRDNLKKAGTHDPNPVRIIYDLLTSPRLAGLPTANIDKDTSADFTTDGFSFDEAYAFLENEAAKINVSFNEETSILKIIEEIAFASNIDFFSSAQKSSSVDRRIRLFASKVVNPCRTIPALQIFSTRDSISGLEMHTEQDTVYNKIQVTNFDSSKSNKDEFDMQIKEAGAADRILQIGAESSPKAYLFDSSAYALVMADRLLGQFQKPAQLFDIEMDSSGFPLELTDYIQIHDEIVDANTVVQVSEQRLNLDKMTVSLKAARYTRLYGPDELIPLKKWGFVDCALACNLEAPSGCNFDGASYHAF